MAAQELIEGGDHYGGHGQRGGAQIVRPTETVLSDSRCPDPPPPHGRCCSHEASARESINHKRGCTLLPTCFSRLSSSSRLSTQSSCTCQTDISRGRWKSRRATLATTAFASGPRPPPSPPPPSPPPPPRSLLQNVRPTTFLPAPARIIDDIDFLRVLRVTMAEWIQVIIAWFEGEERWEWAGSSHQMCTMHEKREITTLPLQASECFYDSPPPSQRRFQNRFRAFSPSFFFFAGPICSCGCFFKYKSITFCFSVWPPVVVNILYFLVHTIDDLGGGYGRNTHQIDSKRPP